MKIVCPQCGLIAEYDNYYGRYICTRCSWEGEQQMKHKLQWYVYRHNHNTKKIEPWNIFEHTSFREDIIKALKKCDTIEELRETVKKEVMYYFWSKFEYEVIISEMLEREPRVEEKVDVYSQVMLNYDSFISYLWKERRWGSVADWVRTMSTEESLKDIEPYYSEGVE